MQFWIPVVSKYHKEYKTLADVPEGVRCVVRSQDGPLTVRVRKGDYGHTFYPDICTLTRKCGPADRYNVVQILDPLPDPPKATIQDLPDGRCFYRADPDRVYWKEDEYIMTAVDGQVWPHHQTHYPLSEAVTVLDLEMQLQDVPVTVSSN